MKQVPERCPAWCQGRHGDLDGEDGHVHESGALLVRHTVLRLCAMVDAGVVDGPYVLVGPDEYTLHEAEALIAALTQLVDQGSDVTPARA